MRLTLFSLHPAKFKHLKKTSTWDLSDDLPATKPFAEDGCYSTQLGQAATSNACLALRVKYVEVYDCMFWVKQLSLLLLATRYERKFSVTLFFIYIQMPIFCLKWNLTKELSFPRWLKLFTLGFLNKMFVLTSNFFLVFWRQCSSSSQGSKL